MKKDKTRTKPGLSELNARRYESERPAWWYNGITDDAIEHILLFQSKKSVIVSCEFGSDNVTDGKGSEIFVEYLPITPGLMLRIRNWCRLLDKLFADQAVSDEPINWQPFVDEGYGIAVALKRELPDWCVHYADEFKTYLAPDRHFCPEILPDGNFGPCALERWKNTLASDMTNTFVR